MTETQKDVLFEEGRDFLLRNNLKPNFRTHRGFFFKKKFVDPDLDWFRSFIKSRAEENKIELKDDEVENFLHHTAVMTYFMTDPEYAGSQTAAPVLNSFDAKYAVDRWIFAVIGFLALVAIITATLWALGVL